MSDEIIKLMVFGRLAAWSTLDELVVRLYSDNIEEKEWAENALKEYSVMIKKAMDNGNYKITSDIMLEFMGRK